MFIYRVVKALDKNQVAYGIVGGFAVMLHGAVRGTFDIDIIIKITKKDFIKAEAALIELGLQPRLPVGAEQIFDFREEYIKNKSLVAWNFYNPKLPSEQVDIIITHDLKKLKTVTMKSGDISLKVISLSDLIKMKTQSGRPQDLIDAKALKDLKESKK